MKTSNAYKPNGRVYRHASERPYYRKSRLAEWWLDYGAPILVVVGAPLLVLAAITGLLDAYLAPVFAAFGL